MKSRPESASIAMLSSYNDPAVSTTVFPDFKRSLTGFMRKNLQRPSPACEMTPQSSPKSCGSYANTILHEMQEWPRPRQQGHSVFDGGVDRRYQQSHKALEA